MFHFLVTTDTHLGYKEKHPTLFSDAFEAFDEALSVAKQHSVDFVLHGTLIVYLILAGDLFDTLNPS